MNAVPELDGDSAAKEAADQSAISSSEDQYFIEFPGDGLMALIKRINAEGKTIVWSVTKPKVRIEGAVAWITYLNRGHVQDAAGKRDVSWLESAVLLKQSGTWRIQFFHSTRVPVK